MFSVVALLMAWFITYQTKSTCTIHAVIIIHDEGEVTVGLGVCSNEQSESDVFCSKHH